MTTSAVTSTCVCARTTPTAQVPQTCCRCASSHRPTHLGLNVYDVALQHPFIHRTRSVRIILDLIQRTKEAVRKSDRLEASRIQKLIMFQSRHPHHQPAHAHAQPHALAPAAAAATDFHSQPSPTASPDPMRPPPRPARQSTLTQSDVIDDASLRHSRHLESRSQLFASCRGARAPTPPAKPEVSTASSRARSVHRKRPFRATRRRRQRSRTTRATTLSPTSAAVVDA